MHTFHFTLSTVVPVSFEVLTLKITMISFKFQNIFPPNPASLFSFIYQPREWVYWTGIDHMHTSDEGESQMCVRACSFIFESQMQFVCTLPSWWSCFIIQWIQNFDEAKGANFIERTVKILPTHIFAFKYKIVRCYCVFKERAARHSKSQRT